MYVDVNDFVRDALPAAPARVLEIGAGAGALAARMREAGYDVLAIDPSPGGEGVTAVALADVDEPDGSFDAAVAVLSLHHVEPLEPSLERLAALVRPGGRLVVDELDVARLDLAAVTWWTEQRELSRRDHPHDPAEMVAGMRAELHTLETLLAALAPAFALDEPQRVPYLHRWGLEPGLYDGEAHLIATGRLPAVGARFTGTRR
jgi:SAM-dependent methyltransferase